MFDILACKVKGEPVTEESNGVEEGNCESAQKKCFDYGCGKSIKPFSI